MRGAHKLVLASCSHGPPCTPPCCSCPDLLLQKAKAEAMGPRHNTKQLASVLADPMLSQVCALGLEGAAVGGVRGGMCWGILTWSSATDWCLSTIAGACRGARGAVGGVVLEYPAPQCQGGWGRGAAALLSAAPGLARCGRRLLGISTAVQRLGLVPAGLCRSNIACAVLCSKSPPSSLPHL